jgi:hypothetical protein
MQKIATTLLFQYRVLKNLPYRQNPIYQLSKATTKERLFIQRYGAFFAIVTRAFMLLGPVLRWMLGK